MQESRNGLAERTLADYQSRVGAWLTKCLGAARAGDRTERAHRALEEALELAQACGCTEESAFELVRYVYARPSGSVQEEVGGVMVTVAALCGAYGIDLNTAAETELVRNWERLSEIRTKAFAKPTGSPLPR